MYIACVSDSQDFGHGPHPDDEDDVDDGTDAAATDTLSELGSGALDESASTVTPQTAHDKKIFRLCLQSATWSDHTSSSACSQSSKTSAAKTEKELDALADEMKKAMLLSRQSEKPDKSKQLELQKPGKINLEKPKILRMTKPGKPDKPSAQLPDHATWLYMLWNLKYIYSCT